MSGTGPPRWSGRLTSMADVCSWNKRTHAGSPTTDFSASTVSSGSLSRWGRVSRKVCKW